MKAITHLPAITAGMRGVIIYLLAITAAEVTTTIVRMFNTNQPLLGMTLHIIILVVVIGHSAIASEYRYRQLLLSLALVPMVRIISLAMPLANIPQIWWYPTIYTTLFAAAFMVVRISGYRADELGFNFRLLPVQVMVALCGFLFGTVEYLILRPEPMFSELTWQGIWQMALIFVVFTGFVEEFIFRGVLQRSAVGVFGWRGIVYVSLLFAVIHLIHYTTVGLAIVLLDVTFVFVIALFFGWVVKKTGSLFGVTLSHGMTNITLYIILPLVLG